MNGEKIRIWKVVVMAYFKILPQDLTVEPLGSMKSSEFID